MLLANSCANDSISNTSPHASLARDLDAYVVDLQLDAYYHYLPPRPTTNSMAARRPTSTRSKPASLRTRTAIPSLQNVPLPTDDRTRSDHLAASAKSAKSCDHEDGETNIQVVIRCRRRSDREIQENSPIIVSSHGAKSKEVTIETSAPVSSLGVVTLPPTRTYPFDLVFGPEADQAMIYHNVVNPLLDEVLTGYNCTLFAYGQTGTGKT